MRLFREPDWILSMAPLLASCAILCLTACSSPGDVQSEDDIETNESDGTGDWPDVPTWDEEGVVDDPHFVKVVVEVKKNEFDHINEHYKEEIRIQATVTIDGQRFPDTGMEVHGGFARKAPKKSYRFEIRDDMDSYLDLYGTGLERQRRFVLKASWNDPTWLRDWLTMGILRDSGGLAPRVSFAELWVNGEWWGLYLLMERIDPLYLYRQGFGIERFNLYKAEYHKADWRDKDDPFEGFAQQYGEERDRADLGVLLDACSNTQLTDEAFEEHVLPVLNLEDFVIMERVRSFAGDEDAYTKNYYLYHDLEQRWGEEPGGMFRIIAWDADATWGNNWDGVAIEATNKAWYGWDGFIPRLLKVPQWRAHYISEYRRAMNEEFDPQELVNRAVAQSEDIRSKARMDLLRWDRTEDYDDELVRLTDAILARHQTLSEVLEALE